MSANIIRENSAEIYPFDAKKFPLGETVDAFLKAKLGLACEQLHRHADRKLFPEGLVAPGKDNNTPLHAVLYSIFEQGKTEPGAFLSIYRAFVNSLQERFKTKLVFQAKPTFRIHLPGNLSVGAYHRDSEYNHPLEEVNIWVPFTRAYKTSTIWLESAYDKGDYAPKELEYGRYLIFDSRLKHGNEVNREDYTRVSIDFRVIPEKLYKDSGAITANRGKKFALGDYYDKF